MSYLHAYRGIDKKLSSHPSNGNLQLQHTFSQGSGNPPTTVPHNMHPPPIVAPVHNPNLPPNPMVLAATPMMYENPMHHQLPTLSHARSGASMRSVNSQANLTSNTGGNTLATNPRMSSQDLSGLSGTPGLHKNPSTKNLKPTLSSTSLNPPPNQPPLVPMKDDRDLMMKVDNHFVINSMFGDIRDSNRCQESNNNSGSQLNIPPLALGNPGKQQPKHYIGRR